MFSKSIRIVPKPLSTTYNLIPSIIFSIASLKNRRFLYRLSYLQCPISFSLSYVPNHTHLIQWNQFSVPCSVFCLLYLVCRILCAMWYVLCAMSYFLSYVIGPMPFIVCTISHLISERWFTMTMSYIPWSTSHFLCSRSCILYPMWYLSYIIHPVIYPIFIFYILYPVRSIRCSVSFAL